jgi:hypothetical protein
MPRSPRRVQPGRPRRDSSPSSEVRHSPGGTRYRRRSLESRQHGTVHRWVREDPSRSESRNPGSVNYPYHPNNPNRPRNVMYMM